MLPQSSSGPFYFSENQLNEAKQISLVQQQFEPCDWVLPRVSTYTYHLTIWRSSPSADIYCALQRTKPINMFLLVSFRSCSTTMSVRNKCIRHPLLYVYVNGKFAAHPIIPEFRYLPSNLFSGAQMFIPSLKIHGTRPAPPIFTLLYTFFFVLEHIRLAESCHRYSISRTDKDCR